MISAVQSLVPRAALAAALLFSAAASPFQTDADSAALIQRIDAANDARYANMLSFTDIEHYQVFRGDDQTKPAAEMTVKVTYRKGVGKNYQILSQSGSKIIQKFGLDPLLKDEKEINNPAVVKNSWFSSANYEMQLNPGDPKEIDGRTCVALTIKPKRKASNMIDGTLWVGAQDGKIAEVDGEASKSPNPLAGATHMMRQYTLIQGFSMAKHAHAESSSPIIGRTVVTIDYSDYQLTTTSQPLE
jgi:hypothetical protein